MIHLVGDEKLRQIAMINFIMRHELIEMLTESSDSMRYALDFEINKDVALRSFIGAEQFKSLIKATVDVLSESEDFEMCICLLDKIRETELVL